MDFAYKAPPSHAVWFDIWAAGVAINTMCVKKGMVGVAGHIGKSNFAVTMRGRTNLMPVVRFHVLD